MSNISISAALADGGLLPYVEDGTCRDACRLITDSLRPPVASVTITVTMGDGRVVEVAIPNSDNGVASVTVEGKAI